MDSIKPTKSTDQIDKDKPNPRRDSSSENVNSGKLRKDDNGNQVPVLERSSNQSNSMEDVIEQPKKLLLEVIKEIYQNYDSQVATLENALSVLPNVYSNRVDLIRTGIDNFKKKLNQSQYRPAFNRMETMAREGKMKNMELSLSMHKNLLDPLESQLAALANDLNSLRNQVEQTNILQETQNLIDNQQMVDYTQILENMLNMDNKKNMGNVVENLLKTTENSTISDDFEIAMDKAVDRLDKEIKNIENHVIRPSDTLQEWVHHSKKLVQGKHIYKIGLNSIKRASHMSDLVRDQHKDVTQYQRDVNRAFEELLTRGQELGISPATEGSRSLSGEEMKSRASQFHELTKEKQTNINQDSDLRDFYQEIVLSTISAGKCLKSGGQQSPEVLSSASMVRDALASAFQIFINKFSNDGNKPKISEINAKEIEAELKAAHYGLLLTLGGQSSDFGSFDVQSLLAGTGASDIFKDFHRNAWEPGVPTTILPTEIKLPESIAADAIFLRLDGEAYKVEDVGTGGWNNCLPAAILHAFGYPREKLTELSKAARERLTNSEYTPDDHFSFDMHKALGTIGEKVTKEGDMLEQHQGYVLINDLREKYILDGRAVWIFQWDRKPEGKPFITGYQYQAAAEECAHLTPICFFNSRKMQHNLSVLQPGTGLYPLDRLIRDKGSNPADYDEEVLKERITARRNLQDQVDRANMYIKQHSTKGLAEIKPSHPGALALGQTGMLNSLGFPNDNISSIKEQIAEAKRLFKDPNAPSDNLGNCSAFLMSLVPDA